MKYFLALLSAGYAFNSYSVETHQFSLTSHIQKLFQQLNNNESLPIKKLLCDQIKLIHEEENLELLFTICESSQSIKNFGTFFKELEHITQENIRHYILEKEAHGVIIQKWIDEKSAEKKKNAVPVLNNAHYQGRPDQAMRNLAIQQVLTQLIYHLNKKSK